MGSIYRYFYYPHAYEKKGKTVPVSPVASRSVNLGSIGLRSEFRQRVSGFAFYAQPFSNFSRVLPTILTSGAKDREIRLVIYF